MLAKIPVSAGKTGSNKPENPILVGRVTTVFGVKGWVKVDSYTDLATNIIEYQPWWLQQDSIWQRIECDEYQIGGGGKNSPGTHRPGENPSEKNHLGKDKARHKNLRVHLAGVDDREEAREYCQQDIYITGEQLPTLAENEFYWHQLVGFSVYSQYCPTDEKHAEAGQEAGQQVKQRLGVVKSLLETGANDVLVVVGDRESGDWRERLIPFIDGVVLAISLDSQRIDVDWDPEF